MRDRTSLVGRVDPSRAVVVAATTWVAILVGAQLFALARGVADAGPLAVLRAVATEEALGALGRSVALAGIAVVVNGALGLAAALLLVRGRFRGRGLLDALIDLPFGVSPVMTGLAFLLLCGRGGWATPLLDAVGVRVPFAFGGLVAATLFVTLPFVVREVAHLLEELGTSEEEAAAVLGASSTRTFLLVTLPNVAPALGTGVVLVVARALGEFGAVLILGGAVAGATDTTTTFLYQSLEERRAPAVVGASLVLVAVSVAVLATTRRLQGRRRKR